MKVFKPGRIVAFCSCIAVCSAAEPDRWKGLILNETTPQQAAQILGSPKKDATGTIEKLVREKMFGSGSVLFLRTRRADVVRMFLYDDVDEFKTVSLLFKDDALALIHLMPTKDNKIPAKDFEGLYDGTSFRTVYSDPDFWNQAYLVDQGAGRLRPKTFPDTYWLIGIREPPASTIVIGTVWNFPGTGKMLAQGLGAADPNMPGLMGAIDLMSTKLSPPKSTSLD